MPADPSDLITNDAKRVEVVAAASKALNTAAARKAVGGMNALGLRLLSTIAKKIPGRNAVFSPLSLAQVLTLVEMGASGATQQAIARTLGTAGLSTAQAGSASKNLRLAIVNANPEDKLFIANSLWGEPGTGFKPGFTKKGDEYFFAKVATVDLHSPSGAQKVNFWVSEHTGGKIQGLLDPGLFQEMEPGCFVIVNAVYFYGAWDKPFPSGSTEDDTFKLLDHRTIQTPMMNQQESFGYRETKYAKLLSMPYKGGRLSMVAVLPNGLDDPMKSLRELKASPGLLTNLPEEKVQVEFPKFHITSSTPLSDPLAKAGMAVAFGEKANFSNMTRKPGALFAVLQEAAIDVDEQGTEAAAATYAATTAGATGGGAETMPKRFMANHPFLYVIVDNVTGAILFSGAVYSPSV